MTDTPPKDSPHLRIIASTIEMTAKDWEDIRQAIREKTNKIQGAI